MPDDLSLVDENGTLKRIPGNIHISVGGSQPDAVTAKNKKTVEGNIAIK